MGRLTYRNSTGRAFINHTYFNWEDGVAYKLAYYEDMEEQGSLIEVVYGFNKRDYPSAFECSVCGFSDWDTFTADDTKYNYCPNCGAKMVSEAKLAELKGEKECQKE